MKKRENVLAIVLGCAIGIFFIYLCGAVAYSLISLAISAICAAVGVTLKIVSMILTVSLFIIICLCLYWLYRRYKHSH